MKIIVKILDIISISQYHYILFISYTAIDCESLKSIKKIEIENNYLHKLDKSEEEHLILIYESYKRYYDIIFDVY